MNLELLKAKRKERNITQEEMAFELGYKDRSSYCLIEAGKTQLSIEKMKVVKQLLRLSDYEFNQIFL